MTLNGLLILNKNNILLATLFTSRESLAVKQFTNTALI